MGAAFALIGCILPILITIVLYKINIMLINSPDEEKVARLKSLHYALGTFLTILYYVTIALTAR